MWKRTRDMYIYANKGWQGTCPTRLSSPLPPSVTPTNSNFGNTMTCSCYVDPNEAGYLSADRRLQCAPSIYCIIEQNRQQSQLAPPSCYNPIVRLQATSNGRDTARENRAAFGKQRNAMGQGRVGMGGLIPKSREVGVSTPKQ